MVRRRSASPRASSPVRMSPMPRAAPPAPRNTPMPAAGPGAAAGAQKSPGLFGQLAATAGGVAIGSAVGHTIGNMFGGGSRSEEAAAAQAQAAPAENNGKYSQPCEFEWRQFLDCTQNQSDVGMCQSFNDLFKECKGRYGQ